MTDNESTSKPPTFESMAHAAMNSLPAASKQLDFWPDERRGAPNPVLRSQLFSASQPRNDRAFVQGMKLVRTLAPYSITYTGPELFQPDLDVWLELVHLCRLRSIGTATDFHVRSFLKALGKTTGKTDRVRLVAMFERLRATALRVERINPETGRKQMYIGGLVDRLAFDEATGRWRVVLDPRIVELFAPGNATWLHAPARRALGKNYLAKWLHGYFSSHREPKPIAVDSLRSLSGSTDAALFSFRQKLRKALTEIALVEQSEGRVFEWQVNDCDQVVVTRNQTPC